MLKLMSLQLLVCKILEKEKGMKLRERKTKPNVPDILAKVMMRFLSRARRFVVEFKSFFFKLKAFFEGVEVQSRSY